MIDKHANGRVTAGIETRLDQAAVVSALRAALEEGAEAPPPPLGYDPGSDALPNSCQAPG